jgi:hypothetical protein
MKDKIINFFVGVLGSWALTKILSELLTVANLNYGLWKVLLFVLSVPLDNFNILMILLSGLWSYFVFFKD